MVNLVDMFRKAPALTESKAFKDFVWVSCARLEYPDQSPQRV